MRSALKTLFVILAVTSVALASDRPDFTGEWKINLAKSDFGPYPRPTSHVRTITYSDPKLTLVDDISGGFGEPHSARTYSLDGSGFSYEALNAKISGAAMWEGNAIVINSQGLAETPVGDATFQFTERWTLVDDGKTLRQVIHVETPQGRLDMSYVFDKQ